MSTTPATSTLAVSPIQAYSDPIREPKLESIDNLVEHIREISTLPHVALQVIEIANDPNSGAADFRAIVEGDVSLCARVLKTVNSAAYAVSSRITNLHRAITLLGSSQIRNLAITASVSDIFKSSETIGTYNRLQLWRHLVSVGICARLIATRQRFPNFENAFLAGLLHDLGIVLMDQHVHAQFEDVITYLDPNKTLVESEQEKLGFDHTILGARVAEAWNFPPVVQATMRFHHMSQNCRTDDMPIVQCVEVANFICTIKQISSVGPNLVAPPKDAVTALSLNKEDLKILVSDLDEEMRRFESFYTL